MSKNYKSDFLDVPTSGLSEKELIGNFEGIDYYNSEGEVQELKRIIKQGVKKIQKDYGGQLQHFVIKDYKTSIMLAIEYREVVGDTEQIVGFVNGVYPINFYPYTNEEGFYSNSDSIKIIEKKLKKKSTEGYFLHYYFDEYSFCMNFFEDGKLYKTYETINLNKEKYKK